MRKPQLPELIECIQRKTGRVPGLHSLILYGSLVRGDFVPGTSDVDFFVVLEEEADPDTVISRLSPVLEECSAPFNPVEVDIAWEWLSNLKDPLRLGYPYKFLTIYQTDFRENHVVILGDEILEYLPEYSLEDLLPARLKGVLNGLEKFRGNLKMMHIQAGEVARLMAYLSGSSLRKDEVLRALEQIGDEDAIKIYRAYLNGRKMPFPEEFLREFMIKRVKWIREKFLTSSAGSRTI
jgi:predicted nucleotidyltransferase